MLSYTYFVICFHNTFEQILTISLAHEDEAFDMYINVGGRGTISFDLVLYVGAGNERTENCLYDPTFLVTDLG